MLQRVSDHVQRRVHGAELKRISLQFCTSSCFVLHISWKDLSRLRINNYQVYHVQLRCYLERHSIQRQRVDSDDVRVIIAEELKKNFFIVCTELAHFFPKNPQKHGMSQYNIHSRIDTIHSPDPLTSNTARMPVGKTIRRNVAAAKMPNVLSTDRWRRSRMMGDVERMRSRFSLIFFIVFMHFFLLYIYCVKDRYLHLNKLANYL